MKNQANRSGGAAELRQRAEERARSKVTPAELEALTPAATQRMLHELQVHQIELAMQNEELRRAQVELDTARARYFDLYDLAPVGYVTLSAEGVILEANLTAATLLGVARGALVEQPITRFIRAEDQDTYYLHRQRLFATAEPQACELGMVKQDGTTFWAHLAATVSQNADGAPVGRAVLSDITARKQAEVALRQARDQLQTVLDATPAAISWIGADLRYRGVNRYLAESLGRPDSAVAGQPMGFLGVNLELADFARDFFASALAEDVRELVAQNGAAERHYLVVARKYEKGQAAVLVGMDITQRKQAEAALWESRAMLQQILDTIPQAIFWKDKASVYLGCNQAFARAAGLTDPTQVVGKMDFDLPWSREKAEVYRVDDAQVVVSGIPKRHIVEPLQQADGSRLWIDTTKLPLFDVLGEAQGVLGIYEDITERKQVEAALRESEAKYRQLVENMNEGIWMIDEQAVTTFVNLRMVEMLGYTVEEMLGRHLFSFMDARGVQIATRNLARRQQGIKEQHDFEFLRKDGTRIYTNLETAPVTDPDGNYRGAIAGVADITERKRAEEALREYAGQLRELTARLADAEESERRRLAQELHDRVGQNLTALSINLNIVANLLPPEPAAQVEPRLADSLELVSDTVEHIRDVMAELRPPVLDDYGLLAALRWYGQRFAQRTGLAVTTQGADPAPRPPLATEMTLFRIAQEALTNAARHAQARQVTITLAALAAGLRLTVADDGIGFDPELRTQPNGRRPLGLLIMTERAESIGGRLVIDAAPGRGTRVIVEVGQAL